MSVLKINAYLHTRYLLFVVEGLRLGMIMQRREITSKSEIHMSIQFYKSLCTFIQIIFQYFPALLRYFYVLYIWIIISP